MGEVIYVNFRKPKYSLQQARQFLGSGYFRKALYEWSIEELESTVNHPEAFLTDAHEAYNAILEYRLEKDYLEDNRKASGL